MSLPLSRRFLFPALLVVLASSCTVRFITEHDPVLDAGTSEVCEQFEAFLFGMEAKAGTQEGSYESNRSFYDEARAQLWTLQSRAGAMAKAELLVKHYGLLSDNLEQLAKLHEMGGDRGLHGAVLNPAREAIRTQFRALMKLHAALRRGQTA